MDPKLTKLALKAVYYGAEKIPDKALDSIPGNYFKPKTSERDRHIRSRQRRHSSVRQAERNFVASKTSPSSQKSHKPRSASMSRDYHSRVDGNYYNGSNGAPVARRYEDNYYIPDERDGNYYRESQMTRHRPSSSAQYPTRSNSEPRSDGHRHRHRHRSRSSSAGSRGPKDKVKRSLSHVKDKGLHLKEKGPRSRSQVREGLEDHIDLNPAGIGASAVGAIAGGFLGHEVGHGKMSTIGGAILGGLGANLIEKHEKDKTYKRYNSNDRRSRRSSSRRRRGSSVGSYDSSR